MTGREGVMKLKNLMDKVMTANEIAAITGGNFTAVMIEIDGLSVNRLGVSDYLFFNWMEVIETIKEDYYQPIVDAIEHGILAKDEDNKAVFSLVNPVAHIDIVVREVK